MRPATPLPTPLVALALALALAACGGRPRSVELARGRCLQGCEDHNRACVLGATTSAGLEACSQEVSWCVQSCPR